MSEIVPPTTEALKEALTLSSEILRNIELSEIPLTNIALKASRLARLLNDRAGIVEHGLFINLATDLIVADESGVRCYQRGEKLSAQMGE